jgi:hypothetical protein
MYNGEFLFADFFTAVGEDGGAVLSFDYVNNNRDFINISRRSLYLYTQLKLTNL